MEIHPEVYNWLGALHIVDGSNPPPINRSGMITLDADATEDFENGAVRTNASLVELPPGLSLDCVANSRHPKRAPVFR